MNGASTRVPLPPANGDVDILGSNLDSTADAPGSFGGEQR
jgi:hypothetical protein